MKTSCVAEVVIQSETYAKANENHRFRWFILLSMFLVTALSATMMISPAPLMGVIAKSLSIPLSDASAYLMGLYNLVVALACIGGGIMCDRAGLMPVLLFSAVTLTSSTLALPFLGHSFSSVLLLRLMQACGYGAVLATVSPVAALWFPLKERGLVTGIQAVGLSAGIATGFISAPVLYVAVGSWQAALGWLGVASLVPLVVTILVAVVPKPVLPGSSATISETHHAGANDLNLALRQPVTWFGAIVVLCSMWGLAAFNDLAPNYLAIEYPLGLGLGSLAAGKMMMSLELAAMIGAIITGIVVAKIFKGEVRPVMAVGFVMFAFFSASIMFSAVHSSTWIISLCLVIVGFFRSWVVPNALAFVAMHYPPHITGKIVGMWMGIGIFGTSAGVLCGALALRTTGNYHVSMMIIATMACLGLFISLFLKPPTVFGLGRDSDT